MANFLTFLEYCAKRGKQRLVESAAQAAARMLQVHGQRPEISLHDFQRDNPARRRFSTPVSEPDPIVNPIDARSRNPWPRPAQIDSFEPAKGQYGYGKRTPDFFDRAAKTERPSTKAKYNQYMPSPEESEMIVRLGKEGHNPLGITLLLGDKLNKIIPAHVVKAVLANAGIHFDQK